MMTNKEKNKNFESAFSSAEKDLELWTDKSEENEGDIFPLRFWPDSCGVIFLNLRNESIDDWITFTPATGNAPLRKTEGRQKTEDDYGQMNHHPANEVLSSKEDPIFHTEVDYPELY